MFNPEKLLDGLLIHAVTAAANADGVIDEEQECSISGSFGDFFDGD